MTILATFANQAIPSGTFTTPSQAVPADLNGATLRMSRGSWPAAGVTIALLMSFDGGNTYPFSNATFIAAWVSDGTGRHPLSDAVIGYGWASKRPTHVKAQSISGSAYSSTVIIEAA